MFTNPLFLCLQFSYFYRQYTICLLKPTILNLKSYKDNAELTNKYFKKTEISNKPEISTPEKEIVIENTVVVIEKEQTIGEAFDFALKLKKQSLGKASYSSYQGRIYRFLDWLDTNGGANQPISTLTKKVFINHLNDILEKTSASNRNNSRTDLSSLVQSLVDNEIMKDNFIKNINVVKSAPERNKTYSAKQLKDILNYAKENDPLLLLFIQFIYYNFLRPVEVYFQNLSRIRKKKKGNIPQKKISPRRELYLYRSNKLKL